jgi:hypothetical protein
MTWAESIISSVIARLGGLNNIHVSRRPLYTVTPDDCPIVLVDRRMDFPVDFRNRSVERECRFIVWVLTAAEVGANLDQAMDQAWAAADELDGEIHASLLGTPIKGVMLDDSAPPDPEQEGIGPGMVCIPLAFTANYVAPRADKRIY